MTKLLPRAPKRIRQSAVAVAAAACVARVGALEPTEWKFRQSLQIEAPGIVAVDVPPETLEAARADRGDLRVLDNAGQEVAYILQRGTRPVPRSAAVKSLQTRLTATATELLIECGAVPPEEITLETPAQEFVKRARVEVSTDGVAWEFAADDVPLFRQRGAQRLSLRSPKAWLRVTIDDTRSRPVPFTGARITPRAEEAPVLPIGARIARRDEFAGETVLAVELAAAHVPLDALELQTGERLFTRPVQVAVRELRDEAAVERVLARGTIHSVSIDENLRSEQHSVPLGFDAPSRELLVHVRNDDSPPLEISGVAVSRFGVKLLFEARSTGEYTLLAGHPHAPVPRYDVTALRLPRNTGAIRMIPGPLVPSPGYRSPEALAGLALRGAPLDPAGWVYRKAVQLTGPGVHQLELDLDVLAHAQSTLADLRLGAGGAQVPYLLERPPLSRSLNLEVAAAADPRRPRTSRWAVKLPRAGLRVTELSVSSPTPLFDRTLRVFEKVTDDRGNVFERTLATADWRRTPGQSRPLTIALSMPPTLDTVLLETDNGDNPPLAIDAVKATVPVARLLFKAQPSAAESLVLYYGNRAVAPPKYDLALVGTEILAAEKRVATLAVEERAQPAGWSKLTLARGRGAILFWSALVLVVVVLLVVVAKLLPGPPTPPNASQT